MNYSDLWRVLNYCCLGVHCVNAFSCLFVSGVFVTGITALDADEGLNGRVSYYLNANDHFSINATTGVITTRQRLTSSMTSQFSLIATASDMVGY